MLIMKITHQKLLRMFWLHFDLPPVEEYLQRYTLFPELEKLYGHGYEISCCATSPDGKLIASACRSNNAKHAVDQSI